MDEFERRLKELSLAKPSTTLDERILGVRCRFDLTPGLLPGERVLVVRRWVWAGSFRSLPSYRVFFSLPPLWEVGLYITDHRLLVVSYLFRLLTTEFSQWYEGKADPGDHDIIQEARVGRSSIGGSFLEIISDNPKRRWWRSSKARIRLFMGDADSTYRVISQAARFRHPVD